MCKSGGKCTDVISSTFNLPHRKRKWYKTNADDGEYMVEEAEEDILYGEGGDSSADNTTALPLYSSVGRAVADIEEVWDMK